MVIQVLAQSFRNLYRFKIVAFATVERSSKEYLALASLLFYFFLYPSFYFFFFPLICCLATPYYTFLFYLSIFFKKILFFGCNLFLYTLPFFITFVTWLWIMPKIVIWCCSMKNDKITKSVQKKNNLYKNPNKTIPSHPPPPFS